jgi:hypothetical protein
MAAPRAACRFAAGNARRRPTLSPLLDNDQELDYRTAQKNYRVIRNVDGALFLLNFGGYCRCRYADDFGAKKLCGYTKLVKALHRGVAAHELDVSADWRSPARVVVAFCCGVDRINFFSDIQ